MTEEVIIFNKVNERPDFNYSGVQIARWSGLDKSLVSRFLNGKSDISANKFLQLVRSMPLPFQDAYWSELLKIGARQEGNWQSAIARASYSEIQEILSAIAERWGKLSQPQERELVNVR